MTTIDETELDCGLEFTDPDDDHLGRRQLVHDDAALAVLGRQPYIPTTFGSANEVWSLFDAIDALAWLTKRQIAEDNDRFISQLPEVQVESVHPEESGAVTVGERIYVNSEQNPMAGFAALLEHLSRIHIPTAHAESLHWSLQR